MIEDPYEPESIVIDDSCHRQTPDHSECEYSEDLQDM